MHDILSPPAERDLPAGRALRIRTRLLAEIRRPPARPIRRRLAVATALVLAAGAAGVGFAARPQPAAAATVLAMGPAEFTEKLQEAVDHCLTWGHRPGMPVAVSKTDVAVASQRGDTATVLFLNETGYLTCDVQELSGPTVGGGVGGKTWNQPEARQPEGNLYRGWLPGPVNTLAVSSSGRKSGDVTVTGRVSSRVSRLVLQWPGHTVAARLRNGAFGLITATGAGVTAEAELVSYDANGREIDRRSLFTVDPDELGRCYVDAAGTLLYGKPGPDCQPADPWSLPR